MTAPDELTTEQARAWVERFVRSAAEHHERLAEADRQAGDGDYADNLRSALRPVSDTLAAAPASSPRAVFAAVADGFLATGGTSGPLFGMWFREFARVEGPLTAAALGVAALAGAAAVQRLGRAEVGHKTMVDAMVPAAEALAHGAEDGMSKALHAAARAAEQGAEATRDLRAQRGRASYVGEHAVGVLDPGACTVTLFFAAGADIAGQ